MVHLMAQSYSFTKLEVFASAQVSRNVKNALIREVHSAFDRPGVATLALCRNDGRNLSRSSQILRAIGTPFVNRFGDKGLRASEWSRADLKACRPLPKRVGSNLVVCSLPGMAESSVQMSAVLFTFGTALVVPFYTTMILAPQWKWTKKMIESDLPFIVLGVMYIYLLALSWTPETLGLMFASKYWLPELPGITRMFSSTITVASAWIHLLAADLYSGRYVYFDGLQHNIETRHSLVLCLMMCPIGIISHLITKAAIMFRRRIDGGSTTPLENAVV